MQTRYTCVIEQIGKHHSSGKQYKKETDQVQNRIQDRTVSI